MYTVNFNTYADFKAAAEVLLPRHPDVLYFQNESIFRTVASNAGSWVVLGFTDSSATEPASFSTDFPDAVQVDGGI
jgi:hypothetical protein